MTTKTRRTTITIERHEITVLRRQTGRLSIFCEHCRSTVNGLSQLETAGLYGVPVEAISDLVDAAEIHFIKTPEGDLPLICGDVQKQ